MATSEADPVDDKIIALVSESGCKFVGIHGASCSLVNSERTNKSPLILLDEGTTNISLIYSDLATFFLAGFARGLAGAFAFAGALAGALAGASGAGDCLFLKILFLLIVNPIDH